MVAARYDGPHGADCGVPAVRDARADGAPACDADAGGVVGHPLAGTAGLAGRVVTAFEPSGYVHVDGLLVRAVAAGGRPEVGEEVELNLDPAGQVLIARRARWYRSGQ